MEIEDRNNKINSTNENANIRQKRLICILIIIVLLMTIGCSIFTSEAERVPSWPQQTGTSIKSTELALKKTQDFYISTEERGTYRPTITAFWATEGPKLTQFTNNLYKTGAALDKKELDTQNTTIAKNDAKKTLDAKNKTAEAKSSKPPVITKIEFPKVIPITGERIRGLMYFKDPDGDAYKYKVDVVKATDFEGGMYFIKMNRLYSGDYHDGVYIIKSFCYSPQDVTLRVTLYDARGKKSNPMDYSFTCK